MEYVLSELCSSARTYLGVLEIKCAIHTFLCVLEIKCVWHTLIGGIHMCSICGKGKSCTLHVAICLCLANMVLQTKITHTDLFALGSGQRKQWLGCCD